MISTVLPYGKVAVQLAWFISLGPGKKHKETHGVLLKLDPLRKDQLMDYVCVCVLIEGPYIDPLLIHMEVR